MKDTVYTQKQKFSDWANENLGSTTGEWYSLFLEQLGKLLKEFNLVDDEDYRENFFEYCYYQEFKKVYQQIIGQTDDDIAKILKGKRVRYPNTYIQKKLEWNQKYAQETYASGERSSPENFGGIVDFGTLLKAYLKFLYYAENPLVTYPKNKSVIQEGRIDDSINYWVYTPGTAGCFWDEFYRTNIMALGWDYLGDLEQYNSRAEIEKVIADYRNDGKRPSNDSKAVWDFYKEVKLGDVVYAKVNGKQLVGRGIVTGEYFFDGTSQEYKHRHSVKWINKGIWNLHEQVAAKTLTNFNAYPDLVLHMDQLVNGEDSEESLAAKANIKENEAYSLESFLAEVFIDKDQLAKLQSVLRNKKNLILKGAPGVGKTFIAERLAYFMMGEMDDSRIQMIQFHQSYSYEDFIEGYRPETDGNGFELKQGPFVKFAFKAANDPTHDYFFLIDEINRGNMSKVFGELMMLIETDKRGKSINLLYSSEKFSVPENLYIIGMMNTADRSLALLDYALRRRFSFFEISPAFENATFQQYLKTIDDAGKISKVVSEIKQLNVYISEELGTGFQIGHSYFVDEAFKVNVDQRIEELIEYELIPQLYEYWFDNETTAKEWANRLRGASYGE